MAVSISGIAAIDFQSFPSNVPFPVLSLSRISSVFVEIDHSKVVIADSISGILHCACAKSLQPL